MGHGAKKLMAISLMLGIALSTQAALASETESFLSSSWRDSNVVLRMENKEKFGRDSFVNPIEKLQLRLTQNQYADDRKAILRAKVHGVHEYQSLSRLGSQNRILEDLTLADELSGALLKRYRAMAEYRYARDLQLLESKSLQLAKKTFEMSIRLGRQESSGGHEILKAREAVQSSEFKLLESAKRLKVARENLQVLEENVSPDKFQFGDWPKATELPGLIERLKPSAFARPDLLNQALETTQSRLAREHSKRMKEVLDYEVSRDNRLLDYIEVAVSQKGEEQRYGMEVGFNIPVFGAGDFGNQEKARQLVRYQIEAHDKERALANELSGAREALVKAIETFKIASNVDDKSAAERVGAVARKQDPLLANAIEHDALVGEIRAIEANHDAYRAYFEYLHASGLLAERVTTNFLSTNLAEIKR